MTEERIKNARDRMEWEPNFADMVCRLVSIMEDYRCVTGHNSVMYEEWYQEAVALAEVLYVEREAERNIRAAISFAEQA